MVRLNQPVDFEKNADSDFMVPTSCRGNLSDSGIERGPFLHRTNSFEESVESMKILSKNS